MQIKAAGARGCVPARMAKVQRSTILTADEVEQRAPAAGGTRGGAATLRTVWQFPTELNIVSPYDPAVEFLGIYPTDLKTYVHTKQVCKCLQQLCS